MTKCIELTALEFGTACSDQDNMGGLKPSVVAGYYDDVATFPDLPAPVGDVAMDLETSGKWKGDVVMKPGTKAVQIDFTDDTGLLTIADQGEKGGISFNFELVMVFAKMRAKVMGFENATKNRKMFFIVTDGNGVSYLMGDKNRGAMREAGDGSTSGTASSDRNQSSLKFGYSCPRKLVYDGDKVNLLTAAPVAP